MKTSCVFCGSNAGARPDYLQAAKDLAHFLVQKQICLVYGGASIGAMGVLADTVQDLGGDVIGVIPRSLVIESLKRRTNKALHPTAYSPHSFLASSCFGLSAAGELGR